MIDKINSTPPIELSVNTITLPCKVGDTLYRQDGMWECVGFDCDQTGNWRVKLRKPAETHGDINHYYTRMVFGAFGKTIFTSKEEYEKAFPPKTVTLTKEQQERLDLLKIQHKRHQEWINRKWGK